MTSLKLLVRTGCLSFALAIGLGGCGFQPIYKQTASLNTNKELKKIYIPVMDNRFGQQIRQFLQQNTAGSGPEDPKTYELDVTPSLSEEAIDIHYDNSSGRARMTGNAHWVLKTISINPVVLAQGDAQTMDGYNITFEQYFAQMLNDETAQTRVAQNLANEVTQQVAIWFKHNDAFQEAAKKPNTPKAQYMLPSMTPGSKGEQTQSAGSDGMPAMATGRNTMIPVGMDNMNDEDMPSDK